MAGRRGGQRAQAPPQLYQSAPHQSEILATSANGRRAAPTTSRIQTAAQTSAYWQDDPATNTTLEADNFSYGMGDTSLPVDVQPPPPVILKKTRNENSDYLLKAFMEFCDEFLDEMLRLEGHGDPIGYTKCAGCAEIAPTFRCTHQLCHGLQLFCKPCIVREHKVLPTHWIEEWQGEFFERCSLQKLGHVIQPGHPPGYNCPTASNVHKDFCVIDLTGIHTVNVRFYECDARIKHRQQLMRVQWWPASVKKPQTCATFAVIRLFQIMNCLGKIAAHDFMRSLNF
ncbi:hypothetical protein B0H17DRAFT_1148798 [Mycena rosella]|uniref:CxC2-like cysteine cluster KDZ transposase-associated domain-containing protein n=1 Tax=Mycena rosella TaxID=1033263 RepID=A0AAD7FXI2_MYCRO|nr:hypothetical protein B0H17DRAFT_1148798 [Mycena rosella]